MGKNPPKPGQPDYIGAANAQSLGTIGASMANNVMSHPNVTTPLGSQTWNQIGSDTINIPGIGNISIPKYSQTVSMSPEQQNLYNNQVGLAGTLYGQSAQNIGDTGSVQALNDQAYKAITSRLDPQWQQNEEMQKTQLANQGLAPGGEAYDNAMRVFNQGKNDAYQQAVLAGINTMPIALQARDAPLNELNALRTGSQVNMPQFQASQYSQGAQGPNTLGATGQQAQWQQAMFNQQMQQNNATTNGLMGLGSAAMYAFA
jgi:hypothetical protein